VPPSSGCAARAAPPRMKGERAEHLETKEDRGFGTRASLDTHSAPRHGTKTRMGRMVCRSIAYVVLVLSGCASPSPATVTVRSPEAPVIAAAPAAAPSGAPIAAAMLPSEVALPPDEGAPADGARAPTEPTSGPRGWLGVELEPAGPGEAGVRVARVVPRSPADKAGLIPGDVIQRLDNDPMSAPADVVAAVGSRHGGSRVGVMLKRQNADRLLAVTLGTAPERDEVYRMSFVDRPAPQFEALNAAKGNLAPTLGAQRGHVVVVEFWAPFCVACRALIPHMNQWHAQYAARGLRVIGITMEPVARAASAATELGMEYPVLSDENGKTTMAYQARAIPAVFVIDRAGTVRDVMVGYDATRLPKLDQLVNQLIAER
jgi:peroxiredoxin